MGRGFSGKGQCNMTCQKISRSRLQKLERDGALFFTFVRNPLSHLVSAASELNQCLKAVEPAGHPFRLLSVSRVSTVDQVVRLLQVYLSGGSLDSFPTLSQMKPALYGTAEHTRNTTRLHARLKWCATHLTPQTAGYAFDGRGFNSLHYVGRVERMRDDWAHLLRLLNATKQPPTLEPTHAIPNTNPDGFGSKATRLGQNLSDQPLVRAFVKPDMDCVERPLMAQIHPG